MNWLSGIFGPKIDPQTPVQVWEVDVLFIPPSKGALNKTRLPDTTWQEAKKIYTVNPNHLKKAIFGVDRPIVLVKASINGPRITILVFTVEEFENHFREMTTRSVEDQKIWRTTVYQPFIDSMKIFAQTYSKFLKDFEGFDK